MTRWSVAGAVFAVLVSCAVAVPGGTATAATAAPPDVWTSEYGGSGNALLNPGATALTPTTARSVRLRWTRSDVISSNRAPTIVGGVGYEVVNQGNTNLPSHFEAFSLDTGRTLWRRALPPDAIYARGATVVGHVAVMPFEGHQQAGGVSAVDLVSHRLLWSVRQPEPTDPVNGDTTAGPIVTDGTRVFMFGGTNAVNSFRLSDGALSWTVPFHSGTAQPQGIAAANGIVYTGGNDGVRAYDATTGRALFTAPGIGAPVVAGGRVITAAGNEIMAVAAAGCGSARCPTLWDTVLPGDNSYPMLGGVDASTGYLTVTSGRTGSILRFSAVTGRVLWRAPILPNATAPVRGASTVWTVAGGTTLVGFSTTATGTAPLRSVVEPADRQEGSQSLAIAGGSIYVRTFPRQLTAYGLAAG